MIQVDLNKLNLDQQTRDDLAAANIDIRKIADMQEKYEYIDSHDGLWRKTLGALAQLTKNSEDDCKCWYCECDGSAGFYFQIDHFRPKKRVRNKGYKKDQYEPGYWWLAFNPQNYRIACQRCNTGAGKKDQFPLADESPRAIIEKGESLEKTLLLDPSSNDPRLLMFTQDGDVRAASGCLDMEKRRVETSITVYNLRARSKREGRRKVWTDCNTIIVEAIKVRERLKESILLNSFEKGTFEKQFSDLCSKLMRMTWSNARFSSTAKSCIKEYYKIERASADAESRVLDLDWLLDLL